MLNHLEFLIICSYILSFPLSLTVCMSFCTITYIISEPPLQCHICVHIYIFNQLLTNKTLKDHYCFSILIWFDCYELFLCLKVPLNLKSLVYLILSYLSCFQVVWDGALNLFNLWDEMQHFWYISRHRQYKNCLKVEFRLLSNNWLNASLFIPKEHFICQHAYHDVHLAPCLLSSRHSAMTQ